MYAYIDIRYFPPVVIGGLIITVMMILISKLFS